MKLATLDDRTRDGQLLLVSRDGTQAVSAQPIAKTMLEALERWPDIEGALRDRYDALNEGDVSGAFDVDRSRLMAPLPRSHQFADGSAYLNHIELVRRARGAEMPASFQTDPLVYQGVSDKYLRATAPIVAADEAWGIDFEAELGIITGDVPYRTKAADAGKYIRLICLINDISLRNLIPNELGKGFGFFNSKPHNALSPFAVTPDELGDAWKDGRVWLPMDVEWNGEWFGNPDAGPEMHFSFFELVEHITMTRSLSAGTLIGSGTVSNADQSKGSCCIAEKRMIEKIETGEFRTPFMQFGDTVHIDMKRGGRSVFGAIDQKVKRWEGH